MKNTTKNPHDGHRERLRNKFIAYKENFKEHELLELLLSYAIPRKDTNELAHNLINKFGSLKGVLNSDAKTLQSVLGVGENTSVFLSLIGYVSKVINQKNLRNVEFSTITEAKDSIPKLFTNFDHEVFYVIYLNQANKVIGKTLIDSKNKTSVKLDFEELTKGILIYKPTSIIVAHNHFSKYPEPSNEDDLATEKIYTLLKIYKVNFYDHLIISGNEVYSYFYENRLQKIKELVDKKLSY